ncbi:hypothetical protein P4O66_005297 [Electrophorus voltai]|uniref:Leucine rich repeat containing 43 n=1 Tax=Electrophorus voltai TaxID=2609070 RepID=A0AAD8ZWS0_9TELE|nr:hypothetical protein P4O66_005297 [Electrophorus voltai]
MAHQTLTSAIAKLVHSLCLENYPCGQGGWYKPHFGESDDLSSESGGLVPEEEISNRLELLQTPLSPWREEGSWSPQVSVLKELAVKTQNYLNSNFIYSFFTTLRVVDKKVTIIDKRMLLFDSLEELVLSANNITELPSENLPKKLWVLELYGNQISCLKSVNTHPPPPLQHLGLGHNCLGSPEDIQYFTANLWPKLVSLDLSWSGFTELYALVETLSTLPCLRSLILEGNPLTLTPLYPGFALDSLFRLLYLDGTQVTPETRHRVNGLAQLKDLGIPLEMNSTPKQGWAEVIEFNYSSTHHISNLVTLKNFFLRGLWLTVEEEKILSWPAPSAEGTGAKTSTDKKGTEVEDGFYTLGLEGQKLKDKKKRESILNLIQEAPVKRTLGVIHVELKDLVGGKDKIQVECDLGVLFSEQTIKTAVTAEKDYDLCMQDLKLLDGFQPMEAPVFWCFHGGQCCSSSLADQAFSSRRQLSFSDLRWWRSGTHRGALATEYTNKPKEDMKEDKKEKSSGDTSGQRNRASSKEKGKGQKDSATEGPDHENIPSKMEHLIVEFSIELDKWSSVDQYLKSKK